MNEDFGGLIKKHPATLLLSLVAALSTAMHPAKATNIQPFTCGGSVNASYLSIPAEQGNGINNSDIFISCVSAGNATTSAGTTGAYLTDFPTAANGKNKVVGVKLYFKDDGIARRYTTIRFCALNPKGQPFTGEKPLYSCKIKGPDAKGYYLAEWTLIKAATGSSVIKCSIIVNAQKTATNIRFGDISFSIDPAVSQFNINTENAGCVATQPCF